MIILDVALDKLVRLIDQYYHHNDHDLYLSSYCIIAIKSNASPSKYPLVELWKAHAHTKYPLMNLWKAHTKSVIIVFVLL